MTTHSDNPEPIKNPYYDELMTLLKRSLLISTEQTEIIKRIKKIAPLYMRLEGKQFIGDRNKLYIGPDIDNLSTIIIKGKQANHAIDQMETLGHRERVRAKRPTPKAIAKRRINNSKPYDLDTPYQQVYTPDNPYGI